MVIFHSYVSLPEGKNKLCVMGIYKNLDPIQAM